MIKKYVSFIKENLELDDTDEFVDIGMDIDFDHTPSGTAEFLNLDEWRQDHWPYIFSMRGKKPILGEPAGPEWSRWRIDGWYKIDYENKDDAEQTFYAMKLRQQFTRGENPSHIFAVWLPDNIGTIIDRDDNPDDFMEIIMKHKFTI